jgi:hypothetical protein
LHQLSSALCNFVDLFEIDKHLLAAAVEVSGEQSQVSESDLRLASFRPKPPVRAESNG